ncbi:hypothetical protein L1887_17322 [Cichorium endivia]|nr:hypothetical protein L1887_17322 [Cichorium endivia]
MGDYMYTGQYTCYGDPVYYNNNQWNQGRGPPRQQQYNNQWRGQQYNNELYNNSNFVPPLYFAQPSGQSVASHFQPQEYDEASPIFFPENVDCQVEIGPELLGVLPKFRGHTHDNPYYHLHEFLAIANVNIPRNVDRNIFRLKLFPFTLKDKAQYWFMSLPANSITTWKQLRTWFLQEFYPASRTMEVRRDIQEFQQKPGEAFHDAFERLNELLRSSFF